jgi:hypothetical protein
MTTEDTKLDMEALSRSLTGFDEIAIQQRFGADFTALPGTLTARSLLFVHHRRGGMSDADAWTTVMGMSIDDVEAEYEIPDEVREAVEGKARARLDATRPTPTS